MNFDGTSLYPSAMWDSESIYPRIETGYPLQKIWNMKLFKNLIHKHSKVVLF